MSFGHAIWDAEKPGATPGLHLLEVFKVEQRMSRPKPGVHNGQEMLIVTYKIVDGSGMVNDVFMLEGNGAWFTKQRMLALGFEKGQQIDPQDLVGRRAWAMLVEKEETYTGKDGLEKTIEKIVISLNPKNSKGQKIPDCLAGLWPEDAPPEGLGVDKAFDTPNIPPAKAGGFVPSQDNEDPF